MLNKFLGITTDQLPNHKQEIINHLTQRINTNISKLEKLKRKKGALPAEYINCSLSQVTYQAKKLTQLHNPNINDLQFYNDMLEYVIPNIIKGHDPIICYTLINSSATPCYCFFLGYLTMLKSWYDSLEF